MTRPMPAGPGPAVPDAPAARRGAVAKLVTKVGWNLIDQMLSTLTNAVLAILVAKQVGGAGAGAFSVAFLLFTLGVAIQRAMAAQVLTIRHAGAEPHEWPAIASRALGTVMALALPAGAVMVVAGLLLGGVLRWPLVAVGVTLAPLLMQDTVRGIFFAQSRAQFAAQNDAIWAVVQFALMGILIAGGWATAGSLAFVWGVSAAVCVLVAARQLGAVPDLRATRSWIREHGDLLGYLLPETLITNGGDKAAYLGVGVILSSSEAVGYVRYAQQILNPLLIIGMTTTSFAMPEVARRVHLSPRVRLQLGVILSVVQASLSLLYVVLVLVIPDSWGVALLGHEVWHGARSLLLPMGLYSTMAGVCMGPFIVIAAMGHAKRTFRVNVLMSVLTVVLMPMGAVVDDVRGAAWGVFLAKVIEAPFWFGTLRTAARLGPVRPQDKDGAEPPATADEPR